MTRVGLRWALEDVRLQRFTVRSFPECAVANLSNAGKGVWRGFAPGVKYSHRERGRSPLSSRPQVIGSAFTHASANRNQSARNKFSFRSTTQQGRKMKRKLIGYSLGAMSLLFTSGAYAKSSNRATVPFSFIAAGVELPAGEYRIQQDATSHIITIADLRSGKSVYAFASQQEALPITATAKLIFNHYGNQYFLAAVWTGAGGEAKILSPSSMEKQSRAHLLASNPAASNTAETVAMK